MARTDVTRLLVLLLVACSSKREPVAKTEVPPPVVSDAAMPAFVRIPPAAATRASFRRTGPGEQVGNMPIVGEFACKLTALFGEPDPWVPLFYNDPPVLGFPLKHVATETVIVPYLKDYGYAAHDSPHFDEVAKELDALLAATKPVDCAYTYWSFYRVNEAGVRDGKPFFEHLGFARTIDMRMAQFDHNAATDSDRKHQVERDICIMTRQNWAERKMKTPAFEGEYATYPHKDAVITRLRRCIEDELSDLERDTATDGYDAESIAHDASALATAYADIGGGDLTARIQRLRARIKRAR